MNSKSFYVRKYINDDYRQISDLWLITGVGSPQRGDTQNSIKNTLQHGGEFYVLAQKSTKKIIGTSWITNDGRRLYLHHFAILPEYQSKGLSHLLVKKSLNYAKEMNMQIKIEVHDDNNIALNLYKSYGFKTLGNYRVYIIRGVENIDDFSD